MIEKKTSIDYLEESAIELFSKNPIEKVTVADICDNCGLSTRTYYNYFKDKYDIINRCYIDRFMRYVSDHAGEMSFHELMIYLAKSVTDSPMFFRNVFQYTGQNNIRLYSTEPLVCIYQKVIEQKHQVKMTEAELDALRFFLYGILSYVEILLQDGKLPAPEKAASFCENAIPAILKAYTE